MNGGAGPSIFSDLGGNLNPGGNIYWNPIPANPIPSGNWIESLPNWIIGNWDLSEVREQVEPLIDRRDVYSNPEIPVGYPNILPAPPDPGIQLSNLVISEQPLNIPTSPAIEMKPFYVFPGSDINVQEMADAGYQVIFGTQPAAPTTFVEEPPVADFFEDLGDLAIDYAKQELGLTGTPAPAPTPSLTGSIPTTVTAPQQGVCSTGASPVYKKVCGVYKWVFPKRRRRRALLTESDYNALLRIEGLKVNRNMSVAIAKALTR